MVDKEWDEFLETNFIIVDPTNSTVAPGARYLLYYIGYRSVGYPVRGFPADLGLAYSSDGINFTRYNGGNPILNRTDGWYDSDAIASEILLIDPNNSSRILMIYVGHCYIGCTYGSGITLLGATSTDYVHWTKLPTPIINYQNYTYWWMQNGVAEPGWFIGPDNYYYLFFTGGFGNNESQVISIARSQQPFSGYEINPNPILLPVAGSSLTGTGILAPTILLEGTRVRNWFLETGITFSFNIGYSESTWPLYTPNVISTGTSSTSTTSLSSISECSTTTLTSTFISTCVILILLFFK